jgi:glyoxylase-like metal-dependent hydrolase (beta-lactamase superfamily II)
VDYATSRVPGSQAQPQEEPHPDRHAWANAGPEDLGDGLYRIPLPLPGDALTAVNVYAMTGDHGVDLIDSGMALAQAREQLAAALGQLGYGLPDIRNFFITHIHQDHYTLAVELRGTLRSQQTGRGSQQTGRGSQQTGSGSQQTGPGQIALGEAERANLAQIQAVSAGQAQIGFIEMLPALGAADLAVTVGEMFGSQRTMPPMPGYGDPDRWLADGVLLDLPGRTLRAIHTPGHTSGHVVFHDPVAGLLFAGDHVLPHITPSIGFQPVITRQALSQYLGSLQLMLTLPDSRLLPAHGPVGLSTHARVRELLDHHETRLALTLQAATPGPVTASTVAAELPWTRRQRKLAELDPMNQLLATGETAAHLEVLVIRGQLARHRAADGIDYYRPAAAVA